MVALPSRGSAKGGRVRVEGEIIPFSASTFHHRSNTLRMTRAKPVIRVGESPKARIFTGRFEQEDLPSVASAKEGEAVAPDADIIFACPTGPTVPLSYDWRTPRQALCTRLVLRLFHVEQFKLRLHRLALFVLAPHLVTNRSRIPSLARK